MMTHKLTQRPRHLSPSTRGFTLLEVMVALVIFSIGLLGLAALQGRAVSNNNGAYQRSLATFLISDIMDRMRANRDTALNGAYVIAFQTSPPSATCSLSTSNCNAAQQAAADLYEWKQELSTALPNGDGSITMNPTTGGPGTVFTVTVEWTDPNVTGGLHPGTAQLAVNGEL